jgi:hypothetical protein
MYTTRLSFLALAMLALLGADASAWHKHQHYYHVKVGGQMPVYQAPVYQAPVYQTPVYQTPVYQAPVYQMPTYQAPAYGGCQGSYAPSGGCYGSYAPNYGAGQQSPLDWISLIVGTKRTVDRIADLNLDEKISELKTLLKKRIEGGEIDHGSEDGVSLKEIAKQIKEINTEKIPSLKTTFSTDIAVLKSEVAELKKQTPTGTVDEAKLKSLIKAEVEKQNAVIQTSLNENSNAIAKMSQDLKGVKDSMAEILKRLPPPKDEKGDGSNKPGQ